MPLATLLQLQLILEQHAHWTTASTILKHCQRNSHCNCNYLQNTSTHTHIQTPTPTSTPTSTPTPTHNCTNPAPQAMCFDFNSFVLLLRAWLTGSYFPSSGEHTAGTFGIGTRRFGYCH